MAGLVEQGMKDGAFGLSTGLFYVPGNFTPTDEVVELARAAGTLRRHARIASAGRCREGARQRARNDRHRRTRRPADPDQPREGHRAGQLGTAASRCCSWSMRRGPAAWT